MRQVHRSAYGNAKIVLMEAGLRGFGVVINPGIGVERGLLAELED